MDEARAVAAALEARGAEIGRPFEGWQRDTKGEEIWWLHQGEPLIAIGAAEQVIAGLETSEIDTLFEDSELEPEDVAPLPADQVGQLYSEPMRR